MGEKTDSYWENRIFGGKNGVDKRQEEESFLVI